MTLTSYHKTGKGTGSLSERFADTVTDYLSAYAEQAQAMPACDPEKKRQAVREYAEELFAQGGPAVDQIVKLFGEETAKRLVVSHMYGVDETLG